MAGSILKNAFLGIVVASLLPLAACENSGTPTAPTQTGPPVTTPAPEPAPAPAPAPTPAPQPPTPTVTVTGFISLFSRSGPGDINVKFRVNDTTFVEGDANTTVLDGSKTGDTTYLRQGQAVTVQGSTRSEGLVYARHIVITSR